jgi:hypothetical protein
MRRVPARGRRMPARIFTVVDLPTPLGPINATASPGSMRKLRSAAAACR